MMVREETAYVERLQNFFENRPRLFSSGLLMADLRGRLRSNPYWGPVEYTMVSTAPDQLWPIMAMLHVEDKLPLGTTTEKAPSGSDN
jgi:hypothetical protein